MVPLDTSSAGGLAASLPGLLAAGAGATLLTLAAAGWQDARRVTARQRGASATPPASVGFARDDSPPDATLLDVEQEARAALRATDALAANLLVRLQIAIQPGLRLRADRRVLRAWLADLLAEAVRRAPCGSVLLGACRHGGRIQIAVVDDGPTSDQATRDTGLRPIAQAVALHGGTLESDSRAGAGTTVLLRLLETAPQPTAFQPATPASIASAASTPVAAVAPASPPVSVAAR